MGLVRTLLLFGSENVWLKKQIPKFGFVKKAVKRFIPGEDFSLAIDSAVHFQQNGIYSMITYVGENIANLHEAEKVVEQYIIVLEQIKIKKLNTEISLKLTQIGLDLSNEQTHLNFQIIAEKALETGTTVWIDMESRDYTESTIAFFKQQRKQFSNIGICLQAYLYRTGDDLLELLKMSTTIRLVKGAYKEPKEIAIRRKKMVDKNYYDLSKQLFQAIKQKNMRVAFATHDMTLVEKIIEEANRLTISKEKIEFQMLYGIKTKEQYRLAEQQVLVRVLISYGEAWFAWYMRRLAERPANIWFVVKNLFSQ